MIRFVIFTWPGSSIHTQLHPFNSQTPMLKVGLCSYSDAEKWVIHSGTYSREVVSCVGVMDESPPYVLNTASNMLLSDAPKFSPSLDPKRGRDRLSSLNHHFISVGEMLNSLGYWDNKSRNNGFEASVVPKLPILDYTSSLLLS